jgi:hypothetical protein
LANAASQGGLYAWGVTPGGNNPGKWRVMKEGDWVLGVTHKQFICVAQVVAKASLPEFARAIWGQLADGGTWELVFFMTPPHRISVPVDRLAPYLHTRYQGFTRMSEPKLNAIDREFGSLDAFIARSLVSDAPARDEITRDDVLTAMRDFENGAGREFGPSVVYDLINEDKPYPPKVVFALAHRRALGRSLAPGEVSSGENSTCFHVLRSLGFEIRRRRHE